MRRTLILSLLPFMLAANARGATLCASATALVPLTCVESPRGVALAGDRARAEQLLALAEGGADRFVRYFGIAPVRYAVVEDPDAPLAGDKADALRAAGFKAVLPWLSAKAFRAQAAPAIRASIAAQLPGASAAVIDAATEQALEKQVGAAARARVESAAVPHELGHDWYRLAFWPNAPRSKSQHYGGPGPDWLDEMAAVLMEAPAMYDERIDQFAKRYTAWRADPAAASETDRLMIDLPHYLAEPHPAFAQVQAMLAAQSQQEAGAKRTTAQVITGDAGKRIGEASLRFYLQSAVAAQYLAERSGDPQVLARIGAAFGRSETIAQWLANDEPKGKLPRQLSALQADWLAWLAQRFPAGAAKPAA